MPLSPQNDRSRCFYIFDSDDGAVQATMAQIGAAQERHPHLDVRTSIPERYADPKIGTIRRNLWNAALLLAHYEGRFDDPASDVTGINNDIDLIRMSPRYIARIQEMRDKIQHTYTTMGIPSSVSRAHSTLVKHAYDPSRPNVAKATFWNDFSYWQKRPRGSYDAGLVLPFSYYAEHGGIKREARYYEMEPMLRTDLYVIPRTVLETSPRRFAERLQSHGLEDIWSEDSFGADDACRHDNGIPDISHAQLESHVVNALDKAMDSFFYKAVFEYQTGGLAKAMNMTRDENLAELTQMLDNKKHLASVVLDRFVGLPQAAQLAEKRYNTRKIAEKVVGNDDI